MADKKVSSNGFFNYYLRSCVATMLVLFIYLKVDIADLFLLSMENILQAIINFAILSLSTLAVWHIVMLVYGLFIPERDVSGWMIWWLTGEKDPFVNNKKKYTTARWVLVYLITFAVTLAYPPFRIVFYLHKMIPASKETYLFVAKYFNGHLPSLIYALNVLAVGYIGYSLEKRTRRIHALLKFIEKKIDLHSWRVPVEPCPFNPNSDELDVYIGRSFHTEMGELSIDHPTSKECWFALKQKSLSVNIAIIGPAGSGKSQSCIIPLIDQFIHWQSSNPDKKASIAVYDPKNELKEYVIEIAKIHGREDDLVILSPDSVYRTNIIRIENIWDSSSPAKVASWIVSAWQNFQGKASPEPYWEQQTFHLVKNMLSLLYVKYGQATTLSDLARSLLSLSDGVYRKIRNQDMSDHEKQLTKFGLDIVVTKAATYEDVDECRVFLDEFNYGNELPVNVSEEVKASAKRQMIKVSELKMTEKGFRSSATIQGIIDTLGDNPLEMDGSMRNMYEALMKELFHSKTEESKLSKELSRLENKITHIENIIMLSRERRKQLIDNILKNIEKGDDDTLENKVSIAMRTIVDSSNEIINSSNSSDELRSSILSNIRPFLDLFQRPEIESSICSREENVNYQEIVNKGKILIPDFSSELNGGATTNAIITLLKSRWQLEVKFSNDPSRLKIQVMDEVQKVLNVGINGQDGDIDFMDTSRSQGGITVMATQSIAALRAKGDPTKVEKMQGVCLTWFTFGTIEKTTQEMFRDFFGKMDVVKRTNSISQNTSDPQMDNRRESAIGKIGGITHSQSISTELRYILDTDKVAKLYKYTAFVTYPGDHCQELVRAYLVPYFWKNKTDKWELFAKAEYKPDNRNSVLYGGIAVKTTRIIRNLGVYFAYKIGFKSLR